MIECQMNEQNGIIKEPRQDDVAAISKKFGCSWDDTLSKSLLKVTRFENFKYCQL